MSQQLDAIGLTSGPRLASTPGAAPQPPRRADGRRHRIRGWPVVAGAVLAGVLATGGAEAQCRQALVFALDVSSSVDDTEYRQQLDGLAGALLERDVLRAILQDQDAPMAVAAFEWSGRDYSALIVDWTVLRSQADVDDVTARLRGWTRHLAPSETGLGSGLRAAAGLLQRSPDCWEHTIDISADGKNNDGPSPMTVHEAGELEGVTVNALLVGTHAGPGSKSELEGMREYLQENVVRGPGGFVAMAQSYTDYASAMRRKLLKEIARAPAALPTEVILAPDDRRG